MNLKGSAKALHFAKLEHDHKVLQRLVQSSMETVDFRMKGLLRISGASEADVAKYCAAVPPKRPKSNGLENAIV